MSSLKVSLAKRGFDIICDDMAPDKSISHRCAIFSLLSDQTSHIHNFLLGEDTLDSLNIAQQLGAKVVTNGQSVQITPPKQIQTPEKWLDCGNAGTSMRLYCGLLSGTSGVFTLTGDKYLLRRPMHRVVLPLREIDAQIDGVDDANLAPLHITGRPLRSFRYESPINSAQVKSALILASLGADKKSYYKESTLSRDHTEKMLSGMGLNIKTDKNGWIEISPMSKPLSPLNITVPADPSSGFFFAVASALLPGSKITIKDVSLNPTRIEAYVMLQRMGANIQYTLHEDKYEPIGDITVSYNGQLQAIDVCENIAWLLDELPALAIAMATAQGTSTVKNAKELRVKESNRIESVLNGLNKAGIKTIEHEDGYEITGGILKSTTVDSYGDHRIAMSFAIAGIISGMKITDTDCILTSFPNFYDILSQITDIKESS